MYLLLKDLIGKNMKGQILEPTFLLILPPESAHFISRHCLTWDASDKKLRQRLPTNNQETSIAGSLDIKENISSFNVSLFGQSFDLKEIFHLLARPARFSYLTEMHDCIAHLHHIVEGSSLTTYEKAACLLQNLHSINDDIF